MADYRSIRDVSEAIVGVLVVSARAENFNNDLDFEVLITKDFADRSIANGASLFVYCVYRNGDRRSLASCIGLDGRKTPAQFSLEPQILGGQAGAADLP
jgi:hypothetical protein